MFVLSVVLAIAAVVGGVDPLNIWPGQVGFFLAVFIPASLGIRIFMFVGWWQVSLLILAVAVYAIYTMGTLTHLYVPAQRNYRLTENVPVGLVKQVKGEGWPELQVEIENHSSDFLLRAHVTCFIHYDDGTVIERSFSRSLGGGYSPKGARLVGTIVSAHELREYRSDANLASCQIDEAVFLERPSVNFSLSVEHDRRDGRHNFIVTNHEPITIRYLQFVCGRENGRYYPVAAYPAYQVDFREPRLIESGQAARYVARDPMLAETYSRCELLSAEAEEAP